MDLFCFSKLERTLKDINSPDSNDSGIQADSNSEHYAAKKKERSESQKKDKDQLPQVTETDQVKPSAYDIMYMYCFITIS